MVTETSLYIHLLDQFLWGLLDAGEVLPAAQRVLVALATPCGGVRPCLDDVSVPAMAEAWSRLFLRRVCRRLDSVVAAKTPEQES